MLTSEGWTFKGNRVVVMSRESTGAKVCVRTGEEAPGVGGSNLPQRCAKEFENPGLKPVPQVMKRFPLD